MKTEFDPVKNAINLRRHGIDLGFGAHVLTDPNLLESEDRSMEYGEARIKALGMVKGMVFVAVYVERPDAIRFISVRPADKREQARYFEG